VTETFMEMDVERPQAVIFATEYVTLSFSSRILLSMLRLRVSRKHSASAELV